MEGLQLDYCLFQKVLNFDDINAFILFWQVR